MSTTRMSNKEIMDRAIRQYPTFNEDMETLNKLANAYSKAEDGEAKSVWKKKWYEMVSIVARRAEIWRETYENQIKKNRKKWGEDRD